MIDREALRNAVQKECARLGVEDWEIVFSSGTSISAEMVDEELVEFSSATETGISARLVVDGREGVATSQRVDLSIIPDLLARACLPELLRTAGSRMSTPHTSPRYMDRGMHILKRPAQEGISAVQQRSVMSLHARRGRSFRVMAEFPREHRAQLLLAAASPTSRTPKGCLYMIPGLPAMSRVRSSSRMAKM